jgi:fluoride exporter
MSTSGTNPPGTIPAGSSPREAGLPQVDPTPDISELLAIAAGGAAGALARVGLSQAFPTTAGQWPWVTFAINLVGSFLLGYIVTHLQQGSQLSTLRRPLLTTGLCGTFTTFSTVQVELLHMIDRDHYGLALLYITASVLGGLLAVLLASALARRLEDTR